MAHLKSENLHIFPFGKSRVSDPLARILNEQNITSLLRSMSDFSSYVLKFDSNKNMMEFVIEGYYFKANLTDIIDELQGNNIYATINIEENKGYTYLDGGDVDNICTCVEFTTYKPLNKISLFILDSTGNVPEESKKRISADSLDVNNLDVDVEETVNSILNKNVPNMIDTALDNIDFIYCGNATTLI